MTGDPFRDGTHMKVRVYEIFLVKKCSLHESIN